MAVIALRGNLNSDTDFDSDTGVPLTNASWDAGDEAAYAVVRLRRGSGNPVPAEISGGGVTWTEDTWIASGTVASMTTLITTSKPSNGDLTITASTQTGSNNQLAIVAEVFGVSGTPAADFIGLQSTGSGTATSSTTITLAGTPAADSAIVAVGMANAGTAWAANAPWAELAEEASITPVINGVVAWNDSDDQTYAANWGSATGYAWIAWELLHEAPASGTGMRAYTNGAWGDISAMRTYDGSSWVSAGSIREM